MSSLYLQSEYGPRYRCLVSKTQTEIEKAISESTVRDIALLLPPHTKKRQLIWEWKSHLSRLHEEFKSLVTSAAIRPGTTRWIRRSSASYLDKDHPGHAGRHLGHSTPGLAESNYIDPTITGGDNFRPPELPPLD